VTVLELLKKIEEEYNFECEAGYLKNCKEWQELKRRVKEGDSKMNLNEIKSAVEATIEHILNTAPYPHSPFVSDEQIDAMKTLISLGEDAIRLQGVTLIEILADIEHIRWSGWQNYLHGKCIKNDDGSLTIPTGYVTHLERLINTSYSKLTEIEKESDRKEAKKAIDSCIKAISGRLNVEEIKELIMNAEQSFFEGNPPDIRNREKYIAQAIHNYIIGSEEGK